mgnify:FL=1
MQKNRPESQKNGELLSSILEKANISQRLCSINMGENDAFLTNFIYRSPLKFSRDFSYKFLSSIYHFVLRDSQKRATEKFDEIINDQNILDLNINKKLLIPALERHTLAIININADIFEKDDEQIIESYIQEIYPETFENYKNFLRKLDYQRTGLKNISNVQQIYEQEHQDTLEILSSEEIDMLNDFSEFEIQMESTNNFFYICENLRTKIIPSFYSPTDYKEIKMDYFNKGAFLIRRKEINQLKNNNTIGGQIVWKSGKFNFEAEKKQKSRWFFGRKEKVKEDDEKMLKEIDEIKREHEKQMALIAEIEKEKEKIINETKRHIEQQNKEGFKQISKMVDETYYKEKNKQNDDYEVPEFLKKQEEQLKKWKELASNDKLIAESNNSYFTEEFQKKFLKEREEQLLEMRKLLKKGKNIRLHEIDQFINRYGNTEETRDFINNIAGLKLFKEDNYKNLILDKEEKKLA